MPVCGPAAPVGTMFLTGIDGEPDALKASPGDIAPNQ